METACINRGGPALDISDAEADALFSQALAAVRAGAGAGPVLLIPPDITRFHSRAGLLTGIAYREFARVGIPVTVLPALGNHVPMTGAEIARMFPNTPPSLFRIHDWRNDVVELGRIEKEWITKITEGAVSCDWPVQVNRLLRDGGFSLIISIGQVVPHEVIGMANHAKNIFIGTGGKEAIDKSHFAAAVYGMERVMGRTETPLRAMLDEGMRRFGNKLPPVLYVLTVLNSRGETGGANRGSLALRGLFAGFGRECFTLAASLARQISVELLDEPVRKMVVYLAPEEFRATWLGNKAIYRTRMAIADGGELVIIAPGLARFGEDRDIDALIRRHGYRSPAVIREKIAADPELAESLSAAAHLIHGYSEGRFTVRYCPGPLLSRAEIEAAGYEWGDINAALARYDVDTLKTGWNTGADGERFFFVANPALGLWAEQSRFYAAE